MGDFEPKILGFLCNWCSYAGADLAGVSRMQYPPTLRVIRVMCSGRVDPVLVVEALLSGIDGVLVAGCHIGDCHYITGNHYTEKRMGVLMGLLDKTAFRGRVRLEWVSASEGSRFAEVVRSLSEQISALGPNPLKEHPELRPELQAIRDTMASKRVRNVLNKFLHLVEKGNVYGERLKREEIDRTIAEVVRAEHARALIFNRALERPMSVKALAGATSLPAHEVLRHIAVMKKKGLVELCGQEGQYPLFAAVSRERGV